MEVSYYPGCTAHSTGMEYNQSVHAVFESLGVEFRELDDWNCCGGASAHSVNGLLGLALPARNIAKAQESELPLAIPCTGCFNAMKKAQKVLSEESDLKQKIEDLVGFKYKGKLQIMAMIDFLLNTIGLDEVKKNLKKPLKGLKVVSYYGCALVRRPEITELGDHENPVFLDNLVEALGGQALDWSFKTDCCGADLTFSHISIVMEMADKIAGMAIEAGADCMVCHCGLCQINLEQQTGKNGTRVPTFYFSELMGIAMDLPDRGSWWKKHIVAPDKLLGALNLLA